ncbi:14107_t:CDS:2 [Gigaspora margarita]|uniref:14107_t:CDS:1 n=1 Tax=Gigaspora margarita TaxID=4874 RepID=A0ABN7UCL0_GIGMA|nr:14107_t:CDS:2 [Gigaspora margarita]
MCTTLAILIGFTALIVYLAYWMFRCQLIKHIQTRNKKLLFNSLKV